MLNYFSKNSIFFAVQVIRHMGYMPDNMVYIKSENTLANRTVYFLLNLPYSQVI